LQHNITRSITILAILLIVAGCFSSIQTVKATDGVYTKEYSYSYGYDDWTLTVSIPKNVYDAYKSVPLSYRVQNGPAGYGYLTTTKDPYLIDIANELERASNESGYDKYQTVSMILAFVQSLPYTSDSSSAAYDEYPRFPLETLVDDGGDCEDTSILFASIMDVLGYNVIYISPPGHLAVGVWGEDTLPGYYWTYEDRRYFYCETTGKGFEIGELPPEYSPSQEAYLYDINFNSQYVPSQNLVLTTQDSELPADLIFTFVIVTVVAIVIGLVIFQSTKNKKISTTHSPVSVSYNQSLSSPKLGSFCQHCGIQNQDGATFCEKCGNKIN
jgi:hypothetical protein